MTSEDYTPLAVRTESAPLMLLSSWLKQHAFAQAGAPPFVDSTRFLHALAGFGSEMFELEFETNKNPEGFHDSVDEEVGDLCWYLAIAKDCLQDKGLRFMHWDEPNLAPDIAAIRLDWDVVGSAAMMAPSNLWDLYLHELRRQIGFAFEHGKALCFYDRVYTKTWSTDVCVLLHTVFDNIDQLLEKIAEAFGKLSIEEIREKNIEKLRARYPGKFTTEHANARLDKAAS